MISILPWAVVIVLLILSMAFFTLLEQKLLSYIQIRKGPRKTIIIGLLQPGRDGIKLFSKESRNIRHRNKTIFLLTPLASLLLAIILWIILPLPHTTTSIPYTIILFLCISRITVYTIIVAGWSSNSKFCLIGALRGVAQTISYEITIALIIISLIIQLISFDSIYITIASNTNLSIIILILLLIWFTTSLAETNRTPFDLSEGERELVSGFNTEYSGTEFAFLFIAEYLNIILISLITRFLFFSSTNLWFLYLTIKTITISTIFIIIRGALPRLRYDRLIILTWLSFLPISLTAPLILLSL